ncbi:MAG TPA: FkbM family methyltransferase [Pirellulales bacterium]|nr:FkbM family methyltransferase [Pirellulales bacterium]
MDDLERFIRYHVTSDDVVLDIGANQGLIANLVSQLAESVYCLEPNAAAFSILEKNVTAAKTRLLQFAASDRCGTIDFYLDKRPNMCGVASSVNVLDDLHQQNQAEKVSVQAVTIDRLCEQYRIRPTFIKVDVEGYEPAVFRGARETIRRHRPILVFEFWESWWNNGFSSLFADLEPYYHLVRIQDGVNVSQVYRSERGDKTVDIAALPRRAVGRRASWLARGAVRDWYRSFRGRHVRAAM